ncbi:MAG: polymer-forming cytoskeletal protein [Acidaminobacteraceae bacterium]
MFNNTGSKKETESKVEFDVIMGSKTKINGNIDSEGSIRIDGTLNGNITASGDVIIGPNAEINGNINSSNIDISGIVNGNINALNTLKIYESGRLNGDFECSNFHISDGGFFSGNCVVKGNTAKVIDDEEFFLDLDVDVKENDIKTEDKKFNFTENIQKGSKRFKKV